MLFFLIAQGADWGGCPVIKHQYQEIELKKLEFDEENYRIFFGKGQSETLRLLIEKEDMNLVDMAKDIAANGLSPIDITAVVKKEDTDVYTVIEGNRRLAAIRLLENPSLTDNRNIKNALSLTSEQYSHNPIKTILCTVMPDKETAMAWVDRKQGTGMGGAGLRRADYVQNAVRKGARGEYEKWYAAVCHLKKSGHIKEGDVPERKVDRQGTGAAIERVFGTAFLSEQLGINISSSGEVNFDNDDAESGNKLLLSILTHLIERKLSTEDVQTLEKRQEILQNFLDKSVKKQPSLHSTDNSSSTAKPPSKTDEAKDKNKGTIEPQNAEVKKAIYSPQPSKPRTKLAPGNLRCPSSVSNQRIRRLLIEIQKLNISETINGRPLTAGVVMRVFLDLTVTYFLIETNVRTPEDVKSWDSYRAKLPKKLETALSVIDPSNLDRKLDNVRTALNKDFHHSINRLNEQIHALNEPILTQQECTEYWDRYAPLFKAIFEHLPQND